MLSGRRILEYDLIHEKETKEENGVRVEISINGWRKKWFWK